MKSIYKPAFRDSLKITPRRKGDQRRFRFTRFGTNKCFTIFAEEIGTFFRFVFIGNVFCPSRETYESMAERYNCRFGRDLGVHSLKTFKVCMGMETSILDDEGEEC